MVFLFLHFILVHFVPSLSIYLCLTSSPHIPSSYNSPFSPTDYLMVCFNNKQQPTDSYIATYCLLLKRMWHFCFTSEKFQCNTIQQSRKLLNYYEIINATLYLT